MSEEVASNVTVSNLTDNNIKPEFDLIYFWFNVVVIGLGIPINLINAILISILKRPRRTWQYLQAMSFSGFVFLISFAVFICQTIDLFKSVYSWACKLNYFATYFTTCLTSWLWCAMSCHRCWQLINPWSSLKQYRIKSRHVIIMVVAVCAVSQCWTLVLIERVENNHSEICDFEISVSIQTIIFLQVYDAVFSYFIPFIIVCATATIAIYRAFYYMRHKQKLKRQSDAKTSAAARLIASSIRMTKQLHTYDNNSKGAVVVARKKHSAKIKECQSTITNNGYATAVVRHPIKQLLSHNSSASAINSVYRKHKWQIIRKTLAVAMIDLSLNLPNQIIRLITTYDPNFTTESWQNMLITRVAYSLYYSQYLANTIYFYVLIYGKLPVTKSVETGQFFLFNPTSTTSTNINRCTQSLDTYN